MGNHLDFSHHSFNSATFLYHIKAFNMKVITLLMALGFLCPSPETTVTPTQEIIVLSLDQEDSKAEIEQFLNQLKQHGLELKKQSFSRSLGKIKRFKLQITHPDGLDWKIVGQGFSTFQLRLHLDTGQKIQQFSYRFNNKGAFSKPLSLRSCGQSDYQFGGKHSASTSFIMK